MQIIILLTVLSLAPAILILMTSFTRIVIVLSLLRQALGTQQLPPNQILIGLSLFMTFLVMGPTWQRVNKDAAIPAVHERRHRPRRRRLGQLRADPNPRSSCRSRSASTTTKEDVLHAAPPGGQPDAKEHGKTSAPSR